MNDKNAMTTALPLIVFLAIVTLFFAHASSLVIRDNIRLKKKLDDYSRLYLYKSGMTSLWEGSKGTMLSYQLRSFDAGRNWYVSKHDGENLIIVGPAEEVYPGLLKHLDSMDRLTARVQTSGPLNLGDTKDLELLQSVGFTIQTNK